MTALAAALFCFGLCCILLRNNLLFTLIGLELMLNAAALVFILGGSLWGQADGQVLYLLLLTIAGAEIAIGLGLVILLYRRQGNLNLDKLKLLKD